MSQWVAILVSCIVLLTWPAEGIHRLHRLERAHGSTASAQAKLDPRAVLHRSRLAAEATQSVIDALVSLEAELRSGATPSTALWRAGSRAPVWPTAKAALELGGNVAEALHRDAKAQPILGQLAACWEVSEHSGSGLARAVTMLAQSARAGEEIRAALNAELAASRATARVLICLPAFGIVLGIGMGADPVGWLLGSTAGVLCCVAGALLTLGGWWWSHLLVRAVERQL